MPEVQEGELAYSKVSMVTLILYGCIYKAEVGG